MNDSRFYAILIVIVAVVGLGTIVTLDYVQPTGINVTLVEKVMTIITIVLPVLIGRLGAAKEIQQNTDITKDLAEAVKKNGGA